MDASISVSLGAMRPLLKKLDMMLGPHGCKLTKGVNDRSQLLKDDLEEIGAYFDDLSEVEDPPLAAKCWMKEARELSYDILDCIDNFVPRESLGYKSDHKRTHVKIPKRLKWPKQIEYAAPDVSGHVVSKTICVVIRTPRKLKWYQQMVEKVSEFRIYAREAIRRYERYMLHCYSTSAARRFSAIGPIMPMSALPCEKTCSGLVIDGRMSNFINSLANDADQQLKVVSIHGSGCLGKTMLANVLYNKIGRKFHCRAFVQVSKKPDMKRLFRDMLSQFQRKQPQASQDASNELRVIAENIRNYLHGKRYLIVVDDLRDTSAWDFINQPFPKGSQGSRIITTTQNEDVALACCRNHPEQVFELKPLDDDHSRKLFFDRLFVSESNCPKEFKQVSSQIVEICGGLPLATFSIASLLAYHPSLSMDLLTHVHDSLVSCLSSSSTSERTSKVLTVSYNSLPHYLKTCLLHLSMYPPEGSIIFKHDLVRQWVAEGFLAASEGQNMEEVAGMYFDELVDRRFIQPVSINFNNEVVSCTVHAVVHDLIAHKSAEENFIVVVDYNRRNMALSHKVRRLSLQLGDAKYAKIPANIRKSQVHSLAVFGLSECMPCIVEFKIVRVLNLQLSGHRNGDQDLAIDLIRVSELFHLRYLKIVCDVCIKLPNRMRGLQCLETLDVMDTPRGTFVPWDIIYLPCLLHLSLPPHTNLLDWSVGEDLSLCKLNHLQDLCISTPPSSDYDHMYRNMDALDYLMYEHNSLKTVKLVAHGSSASYGDASKARVLWMLDKPNHHTQKFEVSTHSPVIFCDMHLWKIQLGNLCILKIAVYGLPVNDVGILSRLPGLTAPSLYVEKSPGIKIIFCTGAGFTTLKYLKLRFMSGIAWLKFEPDAMPKLWKLRFVFDAIPQSEQSDN